MGEAQQKSKMPKIIAIVVAVLLVVGGSIAAFVVTNLSGKEQYFLAEKNSIEKWSEKIEERYEPELKWVEQSKENPTESTVDLSAEYNLPSGSVGYGQMDPAQLINNSTISITSATDMKNKEMSAKVNADIGGMKIDGVDFYMTADKLMLGLPFIEELISLNGDDFGTLLHELDPATFTGEESIDLESMFEGTLTEEDLEYFKKEYAEMIYDEIPDDAFESKKESIKVHNESLDTEKVTMHITEEKVKNILNKVLDKLEKDEKVKELLREQMEFQQLGGTAVDSEFEQMISDFESGISEAKNGLKDFQIPDGLNSTIWIHDDVIAQRDVSIKMGPNKDELVTFTVKGTQLLKDEKQSFNYDLAYKDSLGEGKLNIAGDLAWKDNKASDSITLTIEDTKLKYEGTETLKDNKRDFERTFTLEEPTSGGGSLIWNGSSTYKKDTMNSEHNFSVESPAVNQDMFTLNAKVSGKTVDSVDIPEGDNVKDLGKMKADELRQYFEMEVTPKFQQWLFGMLSEGGGTGF